MTGFANPVVAGKLLVRDAIQSPNYVPGVIGWAINKDGSAEFASGAIRGNIPVSQVASGAINGLFTVGNVAGSHVEIGTNGGGKSGVRLYAADGTTVLIDLDVTSGPSVPGSAVTGSVANATAAGTVTGSVGAAVALPGGQVTGTVPAATSATNQTGTGTISGLLRIGAAGGSHAEIGTNGAKSGIRLYASDGVTILVDLDSTNGNATFSGVVNVKGTNASAIRIAGAGDGLSYSTQYFYSPDGTNFAYINLISDASLAAASLGINSGQYTPADGTVRRNRVYMTQTELRTEVMKVAGQVTMGGYTSQTPTNAYFGYMDRSISTPGIYAHMLAQPNLISFVSDTPTALVFRANGSSILTQSHLGLLEAVSTGVVTFVASGAVAASVLIPGTTILVTTKYPNAVMKIDGVVDFSVTTAAAGAFVGELWSGATALAATAQAKIIVLGTNTVTRATVNQSWQIPLPVAGTYIFELRVRKNIAAAGGATASPNSGLTATLWDIAPNA